MQLERLILQGFRNLHGPEGVLEWRPHPRFNLIVGDNGQGKTNLLEAVALLAGLRSFRANKLSECITFSADQASISAIVAGKAGPRQLGLGLSHGHRRLMVDGKAVTAASAFVGNLSAVVFTTQDLQLPHAEPEARRRWLDRMVFGHQPAHLDELRKYEQALASRNALLRRHALGQVRIDPDMLDVYDSLLARHGALVLQRRSEILNDFAPKLAQAFEQIAAPGLDAQVHYLLKDPKAGDEAGLLQSLTDRRPRDLAAGHTTVGPHRDDVGFDLLGRPAHQHASQGQCRALVLACKIAEITSIETTLGEAPLLLLDDVSSELDATRNAALMRLLDELGGQVVVTTTDAKHIAVAAPRQIFRVQSGQFQAEGAQDEVQP